MVNAFFETNRELTTDEDWKTFTKDGLKDLKFLYSNTDAEDPRVLYLIVTHEQLLTHAPAIQGPFLWTSGSVNFCSSFQCHQWCSNCDWFEE